MLDIEPYKDAIATICRKLAIRKLELVGSAAREDFDQTHSDVDLLVEFEGNEVLFKRYFELKKCLEELFGREVDLIQEEAVKNPYVKQSIDHDRIMIYAA